LISKICWGNIIGIEGSSNVTTILGIPPPSHKMVTMQNIATNLMPRITSVFMKNNGAWYTVVANPIKLLGVLVLEWN
jgi:hypothetical protein